MDRTLYRRISTALAVLACTLLTACGGSGSATPPAPLPDPLPDPVTGNAYNGPGSKWDVELNDDRSFRMTRAPNVNAPIDMTVDGTYVRNGMGFVLLTVVSATGNDAPAPGDMAWAIEAEGYALMLYTDGDSFIPMIKSGVCASSDLTGNWVIARKHANADATAVDSEYFGSFSFDAATGVGSLPARHSLSDGFPSAGSAALDPGTCADGIMQVDDAVMYLTDNGGAIVHTNLDEPAEQSFIFALAQKSVSSVAALDAEYAGILFDSSSASGQQISPVSMACTGGLCTGAFVSDVVAMTTAGTFTVDLFGTINAPLTGFLTGSVRDDVGNSGNLACMVDENVQGGGQRLVSCVGQAPGNNQRMFNLFFASNQ